MENNRHVDRIHYNIKCGIIDNNSTLLSFKDNFMKNQDKMAYI